MPILQQQTLDYAHENEMMAAYQKEQNALADTGHSEDGSSKSSSIAVNSNSLSTKKPQQHLQALASDAPPEHFYFYPKIDRKEEKKTLGLINTFPKQASHHVKKIYDSMVEAKQNCEAIAFRGHRLLDQLNGHMKEQLSKAEQREMDLQSQLSEYQGKVLQQEQQLQSLMMVLQGLQGLGMDFSKLMSSAEDEGGEEGRSHRSTADQESERSRSWGGSSGNEGEHRSPSPSPSSSSGDAADSPAASVAMICSQHSTPSPSR